MFIASQTNPGQIIRTDYSGNIVRVIINSVHKVIAMVIYQPLLAVTPDSTAIPTPIIPFEAHSNKVYNTMTNATNLGTPNAFTGYNVQPGEPVAPTYTLLYPTDTIPQRVTNTTTTNNITVQMEYLMYIDSTTGDLFYTTVPINDMDLDRNTYNGVNNGQVVLSHLIEPRGITVDHNTHFVFISFVHGLVIQVRADWIVGSNPMFGNIPRPFMLPKMINNNNIPVLYQPVITVMIANGQTSVRAAGLSIAPLLYSSINSVPWKEE